MCKVLREGELTPWKLQGLMFEQEGFQVGAGARQSVEEAFADSGFVEDGEWQLEVSEECAEVILASRDNDDEATGFCPAAAALGDQDECAWEHETEVLECSDGLYELSFAESVKFEVGVEVEVEVEQQTGNFEGNSQATIAAAAAGDQIEIDMADVPPPPPLPDRKSSGWEDIPPPLPPLDESSWEDMSQRNVTPAETWEIEEASDNSKELPHIEVGEIVPSLVGGLRHGPFATTYKIPRMQTNDVEAAFAESGFELDPACPQESPPKLLQEQTSLTNGDSSSKCCSWWIAILTLLLLGLVAGALVIYFCYPDLIL